MQNKNPRDPRRGGLSLPITPERALRGFMQVDPEKVREAERQEREARKKARKKKATPPKK